LGVAKARAIRRASGNEFKGQQVAVAFNRHQCLPAHSKKKGEHCFPVRGRPTSSSKVLAYVDEIWLEDVSFFVSPGGLDRIQKTGSRTVCCFVAGTAIGSRSAGATKKHGWGDVRLDVFDRGCFYRVRDDACVRTAKYARLRNRKIEAFGSRRGDPVGSLREVNPGPVDLPTYGPQRGTWRGEMDGLNFEVASAGATVEAIRWVHSVHPRGIIVDGSDDWDAPLAVRPEALVAEFGAHPLAWWHTGTSGQCRSGVVLAPEEYARFSAAYRARFRCDMEACGYAAPALTKPECGCWQGEGLRVYSSPLS
jgi:hypothetical protein